MNDLTIVTYTANKLSPKFAVQVKLRLFDATRNIPQVNIVQPEDVARSHIQIYRNALEGARLAKTEFIAFAEDDVLYSSEHFRHRPKDKNAFLYNLGHWNIYTWSTTPIFSFKGRRNMHSLICRRELFIEAMEERFKAFPDDTKIPIESWAEPGKYEDNLGITQRKSEEFYSNPSNIVFCHKDALSFKNLGTRKRMGEIRAYEIPYWGRAEDIVKLYE